jgi:glutamine phosphoribosylpyrophosphate amidotransferase
LCGVLGIVIQDCKEKDYDLVRSLFQQSMIRGKHATGVSFVKNNKIHTIKDSVPANKFLSNNDTKDWVNEDGNLYCIGHIRYSTSDLRYNQPFSSEDVSVAHNGVISQDSPENWEKTYGLKAQTANDSELILRAIEKNEEPLTYFRPSSMSVCSLRSDKKLVAFRNEARPLYFSVNDKSIVFTSTENIAKRSGVNNSQKTKMYTVYTVENFEMSLYEINTNVEDLQ